MPQVNITRSIGTSFAWQDANSWQDATRRAAIIARFWSLVDRSNAKACWVFRGYIATHGYGQFSFVANGRQQRIRAHRFAWLLSGREIPDGLELAHSCDNPACVNPGPGHLRVSTHRANMHESLQKGRKRAFGLQKLNAAQVLSIRSRAAYGEPQQSIADAFGISRNNVSSIVNRRTWRHVA